MNKKIIKIVFMGLCIVAAGCFVFLAIQNHQVESTETIEETVLSYSINPALTAEVYLLENDMFESKVLTDSHLIVNKFVDLVQSKFKVTVDATEGSVLDVKLSNFILTEGLYGEEDEVLYSKVDPLKVYDMTGGDVLSIDRYLEIGQYKLMIDTIYEEAEINVKTSFKIVWQLTGTVTKDDKKMPINQEMSLLIPVDQTIFRMSKIGFEPFEDALTASKEVSVITTDMMFYVYSFLSIMMLLVCGLIFKYFKTDRVLSKYDLEHRRIDKAYGERLARLYEPMTNSYSNLIRVSSVEDLIKISDEIRQPVFYFQVDKEDEKKIEYFVFDETRIYYFVMIDEVLITLDKFMENQTN